MFGEIGNLKKGEQVSWYRMNLHLTYSGSSIHRCVLAMAVMLVAAVSGVFQKSFRMSKKCLWVVFKVIKKKA